MPGIADSELKHDLDEWDDGGVYEILIKGRLEEHWCEWFEGMNLTQVQSGRKDIDCTMLTGVITDQPALHGLLIKIRNLNLTLLSVRKVNQHDLSGHEGD